MIYIFQILITAGNIWMAWYHAKLIKAEKKVQHGLWGAAYLAVAAWLSLWIHSWVLMLLSLFIRKIIFDLSLNVFRFGWGKLFYVSPEVKNVTGLWDAIRKGKTIDWIHYKVFGFGSEKYTGIYLLCILMLNVLLINSIL